MVKLAQTKAKLQQNIPGYSSRILEISKVPIPEPVPPPREWQTWKPVVNNSNQHELENCLSYSLKQQAVVHTLQAVTRLCLLANNIKN